MDETANLAAMMGGSEDPGNESSETTGAGENTQGGEGTQAAAWTNQLSKEFRKSEAFNKVSNFKTINDLAAAFAEKQGVKDVDFSDAKAVLERLGAPKEGEEYGIEKSLPDGMKDFLKYAREAVLTKTQAAKMAEGYQSIMAARAAENIRTAKEKTPEIARAIVDEFGTEAEIYYKRAVAGNGLNKLLMANGLAANKDLARALVLLGREMSEDSVLTGSALSGGRAKKPKSIREGATFSYS
jgi:hypothetical protein